MQDIKEKEILEERKKQLEQRKGELERKLKEKQNYLLDLNREQKREEIKNANKSERYVCSKCKKRTIKYKGICIWCGEEK